MLLPLHLLPKLHVNKRQKIGLASVFCIAFIIIATAIVRLTQITGKIETDPVGLPLWDIVESSVSVFVGSLPALKAFLGRAMVKTFRSRGSLGFGYNSRGMAEKSFSKAAAGVDVVPVGNRHAPAVNKHSTTSSKGQIVVQKIYGRMRSLESEVE